MPKKGDSNDRTYGYYIKDGKRIRVTKRMHDREVARARRDLFKHTLDPNRAGDLSSHAMKLVKDAARMSEFVEAFITEYTGKKKQNAASDALEIKKLIKSCEYELMSVKSAFMPVDGLHDELSMGSPGDA